MSRYCVISIYERRVCRRGAIMPKNVGQLGAGQPGHGRAATFRESDLKICELCGWLNLDSNEECFVCGWHGRFERDPGVVHAALELVLRQHGRLELEYVTDVV